MACRVHIGIVLTCVCIGIVSSAVCSRDIVQKELFNAGEAGYHCFRIPALLFTSSSYLLAFAEGRVHNCNDHGDVHIVLKRSNDSGETWSNLTIVYSEVDHTIGTYIYYFCCT